MSHVSEHVLPGLSGENVSEYSQLLTRQTGKNAQNHGFFIYGPTIFDENHGERLGIYDMLEIEVVCGQFPGFFRRIIGVNAGITLFNLYRVLMYCFGFPEAIAAQYLHIWVLPDGTSFGNGGAFKEWTKKLPSLLTDKNVTLTDFLTAKDRNFQFSLIFGKMYCWLIVNDILAGATAQQDLLWVPRLCDGSVGIPPPVTSCADSVLIEQHHAQYGEVDIDAVNRDLSHTRFGRNLASCRQTKRHRIETLCDNEDVLLRDFRIPVRAFFANNGMPMIETKRKRASKAAVTQRARVGNLGCESKRRCYTAMPTATPDGLDPNVPPMNMNSYSDYGAYFDARGTHSAEGSRHKRIKQTPERDAQSQSLTPVSSSEGSAQSSVRSADLDPALQYLPPSRKARRKRVTVQDRGNGRTSAHSTVNITELQQGDSYCLPSSQLQYGAERNDCHVVLKSEPTEPCHHLEASMPTFSSSGEAFLTPDTSNARDQLRDLFPVSDATVPSVQSLFFPSIVREGLSSTQANDVLAIAAAVESNALCAWPGTPLESALVALSDMSGSTRAQDGKVVGQLSSGSASTGTPADSLSGLTSPNQDSTGIVENEHLDINRFSPHCSSPSGRRCELDSSTTFFDEAGNEQQIALTSHLADFHESASAHGTDLLLHSSTHHSAEGLDQNTAGVQPSLHNNADDNSHICPTAYFDPAALALLSAAASGGCIDTSSPYGHYTENDAEAAAAAAAAYFCPVIAATCSGETFATEGFLQAMAEAQHAVDADVWTSICPYLPSAAVPGDGPAPAVENSDCSFPITSTAQPEAGGAPHPDMSAVDL